ncbi:LysE family translocator [Dictyobacter kobayashii]|uniref:LysE family translocator n=1 Tax=Dictyobacter kobayashii TaxID=2014872 RepID=UPI000F82F64E|nr:LysE family transporter [Dictyobacter kobayashii]
MSYLPSLLTLVGVTLIGAMSPGPDFATTVYYSTRSRREGIFVALGSTSALSVWIIGSMAGLAVVLAQVNWLVQIIRLLGALYLIYLGFERFFMPTILLPLPLLQQSLLQDLLPGELVFSRIWGIQRCLLSLAVSLSCFPCPSSVLG